MYVPKFRVAVVVIILSMIICIGAAVALLKYHYVIPSSGSLPERKLVITRTAGGTTIPSPGEHSYSQGSTAEVTAIPDSGYRFDHWELDGSYPGHQNLITVTMDTDHTLHAVFAEVPPVVEGHAALKSEIRGVIIHGVNMPCDYETIAETLKNYGVDTLVVEIGYAYDMRYPSKIVRQIFADQLTPAINAAHARGMEVHAVWAQMMGPSVPTEYAQIDYMGGVSAINVCPLRAKAYIPDLAAELATFPAQSGPHAGETIDGEMYDYIRYGDGDANIVCYCPDCKAAFEAWLDEGPITDWTPFYPGGARNNEFREWRTIPINELVREMTNKIRTANPDCEISAAVWPIYNPTAPAGQKYYLGQDFTCWIKEGWLDWVNVMVYNPDTSIIASSVQCTHQYATGGPEGQIPVVINLANIPAPFSPPAYIEPSQFKQQVDTVREGGADGWLIWRYGGPGNNPADTHRDIRDYLSLIDMYPVFKLNNINAVPAPNSCNITWITDIPATSRVEFSSSPLFTATSKPSPNFPDVSYWDIDHVPGTVMENSTLVTNHSITLTGLLPGTKYYFRVQSQDANAIATSKVYTFEL